MLTVPWHCKHSCILPSTSSFVLSAIRDQSAGYLTLHNLNLLHILRVKHIVMFVSTKFMKTRRFGHFVFENQNIINENPDCQKKPNRKNLNCSSSLNGKVGRWAYVKRQPAWPIGSGYTTGWSSPSCQCRCLAGQPVIRAEELVILNATLLALAICPTSSWLTNTSCAIPLCIFFIFILFAWLAVHALLLLFSSRSSQDSCPF